MSMKVLISHPTSNEFNRSAAYGLLEAGLLSEFHTAIALFPDTMLDRISNIGPLSEIKRRSFNTSLRPLTHTWPWLEIGRQLASKAGLSKLVKHETGAFSVDAVYRSLDKKVASRLRAAQQKGLTAIYAYEDGAVFSFPKAKQLGLECIYDLPIGYWRAARRLLEPERERWPDWIPTLSGLTDSDAKLARKDEELALADRIFVASQFTANTLKDFPGTLAPIEVIPYGFPPVSARREYSSKTGKSPLKLLFVGGLSQRKGIADLFAAVENLVPYVELTVVGLKSTNNCKALNDALERHRWIPSLSHEGILKLMREHDVLVFPSLFEGFGLVITEAMSQGTPVITTERTAGPDLIEHGRNGWLIEAGNTSALQESIEDLISSRHIIAQAGQEAMEAARKRPWSVYSRELAQAISRHHDQKEGLSDINMKAY